MRAGVGRVAKFIAVMLTRVAHAGGDRPYTT